MEHFLAKICIGLLVITGWAGFCWGVFVSPNASFFVACSALALSLFSFAGNLALWVFYLSKQFSTHKVQVLDLARTAKAKTTVPLSAPRQPSEPDEDEEDPDKAARDFADRTVAKMFNRTKEKLSDSLL